jgi:hypothetical protein
MNVVLARRPIYTGVAITETPRMPEPPRDPEPDPRVHEALTDMYAYMLVLDAEWRNGKSAQLRGELEALRGALAALQKRLDPGGHYL